MQHAVLERAFLLTKKKQELAQFNAPVFTAFWRRRLQCIRFGQLELQLEQQLEVELEVELVVEV